MIEQTVQATIKGIQEQHEASEIILNQETN